MYIVNGQEKDRWQRQNERKQGRVHSSSHQSVPQGAECNTRNKISSAVLFQGRRHTGPYFNLIFVRFNIWDHGDTEWIESYSGCSVLQELFHSSTKFCNAVINKNSTKSNFLKLTQPKEFSGRENTPKHSFSLLIQFRVLLLQGERPVTLFAGHQFFTGLTQRHRRPFILTPTVTANSANHHAIM